MQLTARLPLGGKRRRGEHKRRYIFVPLIHWFNGAEKLVLGRLSLFEKREEQSKSISRRAGFLRDSLEKVDDVSIAPLGTEQSIVYGCTRLHLR